MDREARSLVPAVADAANRMIYEEEGRSASTSKGRPTRAGRTVQGALMPCARSPSLRYTFFVVVLHLRIVRAGQLFSLAERRWMLGIGCKGERTLLVCVFSVFFVFFFPSMPAR